MAEVGFIGCAIVVVGLSHNDDVLSSTEGVLEDGSWAEVDIGVVTRGLVR